MIKQIDYIRTDVTKYFISQAHAKGIYVFESVLPPCGQINDPFLLVLPADGDFCLLLQITRFNLL